MRKALILMVLILASNLSPLSVHLLGQEQNEPKIAFHVTAVRQGEVHEYCTSSNCSETKFTVEGYSVGNGGSHSTEYVVECDQIIPNSQSSTSALVKCARLHAGNDYVASLASLPTIEGMSFGEGVVYEIVSEKEANKQDMSANPCAPRKSLAVPARPR